MGFLLGLIPGLGSLLTAIPGVAEGLITYLSKKADVAAATHATDVAADQAINLAVVQNHLAQQQMIAAQREADRLSPWTAWMLPSLFGVCLYHFAAIVFDSVPSFGHVVGSWRVAPLPTDGLIGIESSVLLGTAGVTLGVPAIRKIFAK